MKQGFLLVAAWVVSLAAVAQTKFLKHTVKGGETINSIAKRYEADAKYILMLNDFPETIKLNAGDVVLIRELKPGEEQVTETRSFIEPSYSAPAATTTKPAARTEAVSEQPTRTETAAAPKAEVKKTSAPAATSTASAAPTSDPKAGANAQAGEVVNFNGAVYNVSGDGYHVFEKGQTLYRLSVIYKISVDKIKQLNGLTSNSVPVGTKLKIK